MCFWCGHGNVDINGNNQVASNICISTVNICLLKYTQFTLNKSIT